MSSSDSEDDCYSNAAQRLKKMKNTFKVDASESTNLLNDSAEIDEIVKNAAKPAKKSPKKRGRKVSRSPSTSNGVPTEIAAEITVQTASKRTTRSAARNSAHEPVSQLPITPVEPLTVEESPTPATRGRRNRGSTSQTRTPRGRGRGRKQSLQSAVESVIDRMMSAPRGRRGRNTNRGRGRQAMLSSLGGIQTGLPVYSVGNTDDYPDECFRQELFGNKPPVAKNDDDVIEVGANDSLDDNEELSVKVYWQSSEFFRFNIRKFQKISQIFSYFSDKENVAFGNLLFTFNDKILKPDDTPDSIEYNIGKFIDGGVVNKNVSELVQNNTQGKTGGVKIKFQCQNVKKPFEISVYLDECLTVAMLKCAEHFELSMDKLKFYFDGDIVSGKSSARELELEGGECVDVKILS